MGKTITVTAGPEVVLRHAIELIDKHPGEDTFARQARGIEQLGYTLVPRGDDAHTGQTTVVLPENDDWTTVDDDSGSGSADLRTWSLNSAIATAETVMVWPDGVDFDGDLVEGDLALGQLEQDALKILAAVRTARRFGRAATAETGRAAAQPEVSRA